MKLCLWTAVAILTSISSVGAAFAADSPSELVTLYREAHEANSIELAEKLVHFRTQDQSRRASWLKDLTGTFSSSIANIKLTPFAESAFMLPASELKRLPATLKPVNWLVVELAAQQSDSDRSESTNYLVAVENGKYFIVGP